MIEDPNILLSYINTKLRDEYDSLVDLKESLNLDIDLINKKLNSINYYYDALENRFIRR